MLDWPLVFEETTPCQMYHKPIVPKPSSLLWGKPILCERKTTRIWYDHKNVLTVGSSRLCILCWIECKYRFTTWWWFCFQMIKKVTTSTTSAQMGERRPIQDYQGTDTLKKSIQVVHRPLRTFSSASNRFSLLAFVVQTKCWLVGSFWRQWFFGPNPSKPSSLNLSTYLTSKRL